ncbi:MAG: hypothetical protein JSR37_00930 [Verrucomicrobia bacterium]|nr:hypothetical protein [Verrucomicrobiota bacterium]MBS0636891.1 hypothetical protein [Verrucomicrobiota bacterium]
MIGPTTRLLTVKTANGKQFAVVRPDKEAVERTKKVAKETFIEAFTTTYTQYHKESGDKGPIEVWLGKKEGYTIDQWLSDTFEGEYTEYLEGKKFFVHLYDEQNNLAGWLSHGPVSETGEMYLSQCSLEAASRGQRVASEAFAEVLQNKTYETIFPGVKVVKLIAREINKIAERLYLGAGFTKDTTIDPKIYGESYGPLYVGYRKEL